jgi:cystathionine beta-lyase/cystathionine gamma-synthase
MLQVADIPALAEIARRRGISLVVDNTFLSPALARPIEHGADLVIHSATKYVAGHGNALGGVVCGQAASIAAIARSVSRLGGAMTPFNAWLILAGIKTLPLRMERHCANAAALAAFLDGHPEIAEVRYPGLPDHPGHEVARKLTAGRFGGMIAFRPRGGRAAHSALLDALRVCTLAVSLGDVSTLVWPFSGSDLIRLSVGLEDVADLQADLARGLARTASARAADPAEAGNRE